MKPIAKAGPYRVFEVKKGDADRIRSMFPSPRKDSQNPKVSAEHMWDDLVETALNAIESGKKADFTARYPYQDEVDEGLDSWDLACLMHPLFVFSTGDAGAEYKNILYVVPEMEGLEDAYFTDDGAYWGDDRWEPLPDIIGDEEIANKAIEIVYDYIDRKGALLDESKKISRNALKESRRARRF